LSRWNGNLAGLYAPRTPFALATGSWLYRMDYGLWLVAALCRTCCRPRHLFERAGHRLTLDGTYYFARYYPGPGILTGFGG